MTCSHDQSCTIRVKDKNIYRELRKKKLRDVNMLSYKKRWTDKSLCCLNLYFRVKLIDGAKEWLVK